MSPLRTQRFQNDLRPLGRSLASSSAAVAMAAALGALPAAVGAQARNDDARDYLGHDRVAPAVRLITALDPATGDFIYRYTLANARDARQPIHSLSIELAAGAQGRVVSPDGWRALAAREADSPAASAVTWVASSPVVRPEPSYAASDAIALSPRATEVEPGRTLGGVELRSACGSRDSAVTYYVRGYNRHAPPAELPGGVATSREDAVRGSAPGPVDCAQVADWGRESSDSGDVEGLVGLVNFADGASLPAGPITVQVRFARGGETVLRSTFRARLNGQDVTGAFVTNARGDRVAVLAPRTSPLVSGRNALVISIQGLAPGSDPVARDEDRFEFTTP